MTPYWERDGRLVYHGDCREVIGSLDRRATSVVTDPPYGLRFMGRDWDHGVPGEPFWTAIREVCKPGAMLLAFGGTRTFHRLACAIEDAGWELRDCIMWVYGEGFPKSYDISTAIDKAGGCTDFVNHWRGYGTALKPAWEPIVVAMNSLDGTFANNALTNGVAGFNVGDCRIGNESTSRYQNQGPEWSGVYKGGRRINGSHRGRWPANLIHDGSDEVVGMFPDTASGAMKHAVESYGGESTTGFLRGNSGPHNQHGDKGSASRFFYAAKSRRNERHAGCEALYWKRTRNGVQQVSRLEWEELPKRERAWGNVHPTVKPLALMEYLVRLVAPPDNALILDPFCGSGTTLLACRNLGMEAVGIDEDGNSCLIATKRLQSENVKDKAAAPQATLF